MGKKKDKNIKKISSKKEQVKKNSMKKNELLILFILIFVLFSPILYTGLKSSKKEMNNDKHITDYTVYYSELVRVNKNSKLYTIKDNKYIEIGTIYKDTLLELEEPIDINNKYFKIKGLDIEYYIEYNNVEKIENYYEQNDRYKNYIVFNKNLITSDKTTFYKDNVPLYEINKSFNLPIIMEEENFYYVEYNNLFLSIKKENVVKVTNNNNTTEINTTGIPVLNYHFVYIPKEEKCNQVICHSESQFRQHLKYIKDNNLFTPTADELEKYIDGYLQLPKSVVITIDDGKNVNLATKILEEYKLNAIAFIVTSRFDVDNHFIKSNYVELQSHSHALHDVGTCPPGHGQGGGLTCLSDEIILKDFYQSRSNLKGAKAFCYPFYEYNNNSIKLLKKAGFTMAFGGEYENGKTKVEVGIDKFRLPRWVIVTYTTMDRFISYVNGGE